MAQTTRQKRRNRAARRNEERQIKNEQATKQEAAQENPVRRSSHKTQIDLLYGRGGIDARLRNAGHRLYADWYRSGAHPQVVSSCWTSTGSGRGDMTERQVQAWKAFQRAIQAVGLILSPVVIDVCLWDRAAGDWAANAGKPRSDGPAILRLGLEVLAVHYEEGSGSAAVRRVA